MRSRQHRLNSIHHSKPISLFGELILDSSLPPRFHFTSPGAIHIAPLQGADCSYSILIIQKFKSPIAVRSIGDSSIEIRSAVYEVRRTKFSLKRPPFMIRRLAEWREGDRGWVPKSCRNEECIP